MDNELYRANLTEIYDRCGREPMTMTVKDAADYIGCDYRTLLGKKDFPVKQIGRRYYVSKTSLASWLTRF